MILFSTSSFGKVNFANNYPAPFNFKTLGNENNNGVIVIQPIYKNILLFVGGLIVVRLEEKLGYIDEDGNVIIPLEYDKALNLHMERAGVCKGGAKEGQRKRCYSLRVY